MKNIVVEMPLVSRCDVSRCSYNVNNNCHAKAITVGDSTNPACDTFIDASKHTKETKRLAGVGACKVSGCEYNEDFECVAENIAVTSSKQDTKCRTFAARNIQF